MRWLHPLDGQELRGVLWIRAWHTRGSRIGAQLMHSREMSLMWDSTRRILGNKSVVGEVDQ